MKDAGFSGFKLSGGQYLYSSADGESSVDHDKVGTYRVSFESAPCADATIFAQ